MLLVGAFIVPTLLDPTYVAIDIALFVARFDRLPGYYNFSILRLILVVSATYLVLMSLLFFRKERHAISGELSWDE